MTNPAANISLSANDSDLLHLRRSFIRHLAADRRTPATRKAYSAAIVQFEAFLVERIGAPWRRGPPKTRLVGARRIGC